MTERRQRLKHGDITEKILGADFEVHTFLGNGFQEVIYQLGTRRAGFVVEGKVLVELKAVTQLQDVHWAQVLNYLKAYRLDVGLLLTIGSESLTFKRLML